MLKIEVNGREIKCRRQNLTSCATQKEFAYAIGVSERRLREIENTNAKVSSAELSRIAKNLSVPPAILHATSSTTTAGGAGPASRPVDAECLIPRHDTAMADVVESEAQLFDLAARNEVVLCHALVALNAETSAYLEELFSSLGGLAWRTRDTRPSLGSAEALVTQRRIRELLVLLKGNDVWVYQTTNFKRLPERDIIPDTPDPFDAEAQLIIAAGPPGEYGESSISIPVDNGQPCICLALRRSGGDPQCR